VAQIIDMGRHGHSPTCHVLSRCSSQQCCRTTPSTLCCQTIGL